MKIPLQSGCCAFRWFCKNLEKSFCNIFLEKCNNYVICNYFESVDGKNDERIKLAL